MAARSLPALAIGMAVLAAVLLPIAVARRCGEPTEEAPPAPPPPRPAPPPVRDDALVAAMFGAVCRHQVACGIGDLERCTYVEDTMRRMPKDFAIRPCDRVDEAEARRCIAELEARDCLVLAKSLDVLDLQLALDRVHSCRMACAPTASSR